MRLDEKKAVLEKLINPPPVVSTKLDKKAKQSKKNPPPSVTRVKKPEPEVETKPLPYLPTPDEIILQREGNF